MLAGGFLHCLADLELGHPRMFFWVFHIGGEDEPY
jgi:hypothetical protein